MKNKKNKRIAVVTKMIVALINSQSFKERSRMSESDFTRNRKLRYRKNAQDVSASSMV